MICIFIYNFNTVRGGKIQLQSEQGQHNKQKGVRSVQRMNTPNKLIDNPSAVPNLPNNKGENKDNITGSSHLQFPNRELQQSCTTANNLYTAYKEGQHGWARRCERTSSITSQPVSLMLSGQPISAASS